MRAAVFRRRDGNEFSSDKVILCLTDDDPKFWLASPAPGQPLPRRGVM